jgi:hypothetical protein
VTVAALSELGRDRVALTDADGDAQRGMLGLLLRPPVDSKWSPPADGYDQPLALDIIEW